MATASRAGPRSGAISNWARFSTSPASANARSANTARPLQTNDNTFGALEEARKYLQKAYERPKEKQ